MKVLSLFSGIGAFDLGLQKSGMEIAFQCECDPFCLLVLAKHWPDVRRWNDVRTLSGDDVRRAVGTVDVIAGGFPCQPHSTAGKRQGQADDRHLWPHFNRLIRELRPAWVVAENVPGLRTTAADEVLGDLEGQGYACGAFVVGADDIGAPHRRKRVWIVAHASERGRRAEVGNVLPRESHDAWRCAAMADADGVGRTSEGNRRLPQHAHVELYGQGWPARPGEPQHGWESPRLVEQPVGAATDGTSRRLVRLARRANREALRAAGNAVVWQMPYLIGSWMMEAA